MRSDSDVAAFKALVDEELRDPDGSKVLVAQIDVGDLTEPAALDALRRGAQSLVSQVPPVGV